MAYKQPEVLSMTLKGSSFDAAAWTVTRALQVAARTANNLCDWRTSSGRNSESKLGAIPNPQR